VVQLRQMIDDATQQQDKKKSFTTPELHLIVGVPDSKKEIKYHPEFETDERHYDRLPSAKAETEGGAGYTALSIIAEIVDNSIQYTKDNPALKNSNSDVVTHLLPKHGDILERRIDVSIEPEELIVTNNGQGMNEEGVRIWTKLAEPKYSEPTPPVPSRGGESDDLKFGGQALPFRFSEQHFNSIMSRFGVGSNFALTTIGDGEIFIRTRELGKKMDLSGSYTSGIWEGRCRSVPQDKSMPPQFVQVSTKNLKPAFFPGPAETPEEYVELLKRNLAHVYFYYMTGPEMFETAVTALAKKPANSIEASKRPSAAQLYIGEFRHEPIKLKVNGVEISPKESIEYRYLRDAVSCFPLRFSFTTELSVEERRDNPSWPATVRHDVYGAVFYFRSRNGKETHPDIVAAESSNEAAERPHHVQQSGVEENKEDFLINPTQVEVFWNGKLFDGSNLPPIEFMDHSRIMKQQKLAKFHSLPSEVFKSRVKAMLFFTRRFHPSKHKWQMMSSTAPFQKFAQLARGVPLMQSYCEWLQDCRSTFDNEILVGRVDSETISPHNPQHYITSYQSVTVGSTDLKQGDPVSFDYKDVGEVKGSIKALETEGPKNRPALLTYRARVSVDWGLKVEEYTIDLRETVPTKIESSMLQSWIKQRGADGPTRIAVAADTNFKPRMQAASDQTLQLQLMSKSRSSDLIWYARVGKLRVRIAPSAVGVDAEARRLTLHKTDVDWANRRGSSDIYTYEIKFAIPSPGEYVLRVDAPGVDHKKLPPFEQTLTVTSGDPAEIKWLTDVDHAEVQLGRPVPSEFLKFQLLDAKGGKISFTDFEYHEIKLNGVPSSLTGPYTRWEVFCSSWLTLMADSLGSHAFQLPMGAAARPRSRERLRRPPSRILFWKESCQNPACCSSNWILNS
jgi:hypothetical protein